MEQNVAKRLTDAVRAFNAQADRARRDGLPFVVEARASGKSGSGGVHLHLLRSLPAAAALLPEAQDDQCAEEIALLSAAEEVNRLADEAWRQNTGIELKVVNDYHRARNWPVELVLPE